MSGKAIAMKSEKEKWLSIVQSTEEKGEKGIGGSSTVTESNQAKVRHNVSSDDLVQRPNINNVAATEKILPSW